ncbi:anti-sigma factor family protein [Nocardioides sp. LHG3406-4]|uniref:anti-sigma factor family protein n=1 Tax=Nocardioides sp. LHG3406-4 TaxID=2804575 RepID=UPI003CF52BDA
MNAPRSCEFAHHDGAYVLGSLSPAERSEFERHLAGCQDCARAVRELAGLPGLLAKVSPDVLESNHAPEPVPATLLPALVGEARRSQRRRTTMLVGLAAAAALIVAGGSAAVLIAFDSGSQPVGQSAPPSAAPTEAMDPVGSAPVSGRLALTSVAWGTRIDLLCTYAPTEEPEYGATYAMVVRTRDGRAEQVATWKALPGKSMRLPAATAATRDDIASVEVLTGDGVPVLRLAPKPAE